MTRAFHPDAHKCILHLSLDLPIAVNLNIIGRTCETLSESVEHLLSSEKLGHEGKATAMELFSETKTHQVLLAKRKETPPGEELYVEAKS